MGEGVELIKAEEEELEEGVEIYATATIKFARDPNTGLLLEPIVEFEEVEGEIIDKVVLNRGIKFLERAYFERRRRVVVEETQKRLKGRKSEVEAASSFPNKVPDRREEDA